MKIAITGHRPNKLGNEWEGKGIISSKIRTKLTNLLWDWCVECEFSRNGEQVIPISGMALGVDMIWAEIAIAANKSFIAAIPCKKQYAKWPQASKERWMDITDNKLCDKFYVSEELYTSDCMQKRNIWMVNNCDLLIAVWDGSNGGTANCVNYAKSINKQIVIINPKDL